MERTILGAEEELRGLTLRHTTLSEKGFAVDLREETDRWHEAIRALGASRAYALMSEELCALYESRYDREYLFSEQCLAFELAYHAEAYFRVRGLPGHARHLTTLLFTPRELERHCEVVDISTDDVRSLRQSVMFRYAAGVRPCYRNTKEDPFDRGSLVKRIAGSRKRD